MNLQGANEFVKRIGEIADKRIDNANIDTIIPGTVQSTYTDVDGNKYAVILKPQDSTTVNVRNPIGFSLSSGDEVYIQKIGNKLSNAFIITSKKQQTSGGGDIPEITDEPTGFKPPEDVIITGDSTTRTITLTGTFEAYYKGILNTTIVSGWTSPAHGSDTTKQYFLNYDGTTISWMDVSTGLSEDFFKELLICFTFYDSINSVWVYLRECHGLMPWESHREFHHTTGTYRRSGGAVQSYTLDSTTAADRRPDIEATLLYDEDLPTTNAVLNSSLYSNFYLTGADGDVNVLINQSDIVPLSGNRPYWNEFTGGTWQQTLMSNNFYMAVWVLCIPMATDTNSTQWRYLFIQGQREDISQSNIEALTPQDVSIGKLRELLPELIVTNKIIIEYRASNWRIVEVQEITGTSSSQTTSPAGNYLTSVTSDDTLTGLGTPSDPLSVTNPAREALTADRTYYVSTTGSDSNDGLTSGTAFLTLQKAYDVAAGTLDGYGFDIYIQVANGTYSAGINFDKSQVGIRTIYVVGDSTTPSNDIIDPGAGGGNCFTFNTVGNFNINGFKMNYTGTPASFASMFKVSNPSSNAEFSNVEFGSASGVAFHITLEDGRLLANSNYTISGDAYWHVFNDGGIFEQYNKTVTLSGTRAFNIFAYCRGNRTRPTSIFRNITYTGSATGQRYKVETHGLLVGNPAVSTYFPGSTAGTIIDYGLYK